MWISDRKKQNKRKERVLAEQLAPRKFIGMLGSNLLIPYYTCLTPFAPPHAPFYEKDDSNDLQQVNLFWYEIMTNYNELCTLAWLAAALVPLACSEYPSLSCQGAEQPSLPISPRRLAPLPA